MIGIKGYIYFLVRRRDGREKRVLVISAVHTWRHIF
jgi:hypothetical protein